MIDLSSSTPLRPESPTAFRYGTTAAVGATGLVIFDLAHLPLPFLLGPLAATLIATVMGQNMPWPSKLRYPARIALGLVAGLAFSPQLIERIPQIAASLALLVPVTGIAVVGGYYFFRNVARFDPATAFFAAVPGGFQEMVAMGQDAGGSGRKLTLIHSTRLLVLIYVLPFWIIWSEGLPFNVSVTVPHAARYLTPLDVGLLLAAAIGGWWIAKRVRLSGSLIVGPMLAAALLSVSGATDAHLPAPLVDAAQFILGVEIGLKFRGVTAKEFVTTIFYGLIFTVFLLVTAAFAARIATHIAGVPWASGLMAFSPGGQGEKNILAVALKADVAYVSLHHLIRLALVVVGAQLIFSASPAWRGRYRSFKERANAPMETTEDD